MSLSKLIFDELSIKDKKDVVQRATEICYDRASCVLYHIDYFNPDLNKVYIWAYRELSLLWES